MDKECRYNIQIDYKIGTSKDSHEEFQLCLGYYVDRSLNEFVILYSENVTITINRCNILKVIIAKIEKREVEE